MKYKNCILPHGGKLRYVKNNISKTTSVEIDFYCGARCEKIPGLAHFTEHMFFTGTKDLNKEQVTKKYFDFINVNASTNYNRIRFNGNVLTKELEDYCKTVAMLITESTFTQKAVDKEIGIVQQEIARYEDKFNFHAGNFNDYNVTGQEEYKNEILGTKETVGSIKSKDVKDFVKKYFVLENMDVYVSSPLSFNKVKNIVLKTLVSTLKKDKDFKELPLYNFQINNTNFLSVETKDIKKCYIYINFPINRTDYDFEFQKKFGLALRMMNDHSEGISKEIRLNKSLVYGCVFDSYYNDKKGLVTFITECEKQNVNAVIETVAEYIKGLLKNGFTAEQLRKAKRLYKHKEDAEEPKVSRKLDKLRDYKYYGKIIDDKKLENIALSTTLEECNKCFKEVFENCQVSTTIYGDATKEEVLSKEEIDKLFK